MTLIFTQLCVAFILGVFAGYLFGRVDINMEIRKIKERVESLERTADEGKL